MCVYNSYRFWIYYQNLHIYTHIKPNCMLFGINNNNYIYIYIYIYKTTKIMKTKIKRNSRVIIVVMMMIKMTVTNMTKRLI